MTILLTGAFGNIGQSTLTALLENGHTVRCFDLPTRANLKAAKRRAGQVDLCWGDLRSAEAVEQAVQGCEGVIHLGFVIPKLSVTGVNSEERPDWARSINVGGTQNLITAMQQEGKRRFPSAGPRLVLASSLHIYGKTQHLPPPRRVEDAPCPVEHYAHHKVAVEAMVRTSGLQWSILRLAAALPVRLIMDPGMFDVPLDNRIEFVHTLDAGQAFARAVDHPGVWCKTLHIGGGAACQLYYREMMDQVMAVTGIGPLPDRVFTREPFAVDWLDTRESQALLHFQQRTFKDYTQDLERALGPLKWGILAVRPAVRRWLIGKSPYR